MLCKQSLGAVLSLRVVVRSQTSFFIFSVISILNLCREVIEFWNVRKLSHRCFF